jgi:arabinofuranosyltransferase
MTNAPQRSQAYFILSGWLVACVALFAHYHKLAFLNDDFFISLRYARNWADGLGPVWNAGERVEGYTNFLYTFLLMLLFKLGLDPVALAYKIGFSFSALSLLLTILIYKKLFPEASRFQPVLPAILLACLSPFAVWTTAGLESPMFVALTLAAYYFLLAGADGSKKNGALAGFLFALAAMTRPEGALFAALAWVYLMAVALKTKPFKPAPLVLCVCAFGLIYGPYFIWRYSYYGFLVPNSFYARAGENLADKTHLWKTGLTYIFSFQKHFPAFFWLSIPLFLAGAKNRKPFLIVIAGLLAVWLCYLVYVGGDAKIYFRFFMPILPWMAIFVAANVVFLTGLALKKADSTRELAEAALVLVIALVPVGIAVSRGEYRMTSMTGNFYTHDRKAAGEWLKKNAQPGETLACTACGVIPYYSQLPAYDIFGINDRVISHQSFRRQGPAAHSKFDNLYIIGKNPTYIFDNETGFDYEKYGYHRKCMDYMDSLPVFVQVPTKETGRTCYWKK